MGERITISFEIEKEYILKMFQEEDIAKAFDEFLKKYFADYIQIHIQNISQNMKTIAKDTELELIVLGYLKSCIEKQDMETLQIEMTKELFTQSFTSKENPKTAIYKVFDKASVIKIAEIIRRKIRYKYFLSSV